MMYCRVAIQVNHGDWHNYTGRKQYLNWWLGMVISDLLSIQATDYSLPKLEISFNYNEWMVN